MIVFDNLAKSFLVSGMMPLDAKTYFPTITELQDLGTANSKAYTYYEYMNVICVENGTEYQWREVAQNYNGGALDNNFQYPINVLASGIDYSLRYFNFVPKTGGSAVGSTGVLVVGDYIIFKGYTNGQKNTAQFLEINDIVMGFFSESVFITAKYLGGSIIDIDSWSVINQKNPTLATNPGLIE